MTHVHGTNTIRRTQTQRTLARIASGEGVGNASRAKALAHDCPKCGARRDKACISSKGGLRWSFHADRRPSRRDSRPS